MGMCQYCKWFLADHKGAVVGDCHRYPPMTVKKQGRLEYDGPFHPTVSVADYCGEYVDREPPKPVMCECGHGAGAHNGAGVCLIVIKGPSTFCSCTGYKVKA